MPTTNQEAFAGNGWEDCKTNLTLVSGALWFFGNGSGCKLQGLFFTSKKVTSEYQKGFPCWCQGAIPKSVVCDLDFEAGDLSRFEDSLEVLKMHLPKFQADSRRFRSSPESAAGFGEISAESNPGSVSWLWLSRTSNSCIGIHWQI